MHPLLDNYRMITYPRCYPGHWPIDSQEITHNETPEQLRKRADELEAREKREKATENQKMIDKLKKEGFTVIDPRI